MYKREKLSVFFLKISIENTFLVYNNKKCMRKLFYINKHTSWLKVG